MKSGFFVDACFFTPSRQKTQEAPPLGSAAEIRAGEKVQLRRDHDSRPVSRIFSFIQAERGRKSGTRRRQRTAERDAEIVMRVEAGESMRSVAREFGLRLFTVQHIVSRGDQ